MPFLRVPNLTIMGRENSVKCLGILFGYAPHLMVIATLDKRFYDGFGVCFRRTKEILSRLLIAQMIITAVTFHDACGHTIGGHRQQHLMQNRFLLGRENKNFLTHVQLISKVYFIPSSTR